MPTDEQVLNEIVKLLGSVPDKSTFRHDLPQNHEWLGAVLYIVRRSGDIQLSAEAKTIASMLGDQPITIREPQPRLVVLLQQMKREFEFKVGYSIPRNYVELSEDNLKLISGATSNFKTAVHQDNELDSSDRDILLYEIAIFEASLGLARLSPDLIARFVNGILKGTIVLAANEVVKKTASDLTQKLFDILGWPLSG